MKPSRVGLAAIIALAAALHAAAIAGTLVPAQDGLKFLRTARAFQSENPLDALRRSDQHALYPALIAVAQPVVSTFAGNTPDSWRLTAQSISALAYLACLLPLHAMTYRTFGGTAADLAALLLVLLPIPMEVGHDTLSDSLALFFTLSTFDRGLLWLHTGDRRSAILSGISAGLGYWTRPEVVIAGGVILLVAIGKEWTLWHSKGIALARLALPMLALVGAYGLAKGEASEKLALRLGLGLPPSHAPQVAAAPRQSPIPPKEELDPAPPPPHLAASEVALTWLRVTGLLLAPLILAGACFAPPSPARLVWRLYMLIFAALLVRHLSTLGYLSVRHVLAPVVLGLPWAGWRLARLFARLEGWLRLSRQLRPVTCATAIAVMVALGVTAQAKPSHPTRYGHWSAGRWLATHTQHDDAILDTRGWAAFLADRPTYGPWHFQQAADDPRLAFVVVEQNELASGSERSQRLHAWLDGRTSLAAAFPDHPGGSPMHVLVYRWTAENPNTEYAHP